MRYFALTLCLSFCLFADEELKKFCKSKIDEAQSVRAIEGKDGWFFSFKEIKHLSAMTQYSDNSIMAIADYHKALREQGIDLLIVPVPPKALILKEKLTGKESNWNPYKGFHKALKSKEIQSIDLVQTLNELKKNKQVFCKRDSHFSPLAVSHIAESISKVIKIPVGKYLFTKETGTISFDGDLIPQIEKEFPQETFEVEIIKSDGQFLHENSDSSILLMGDSNSLVYSSGGDMHLRSGGLFEHISYQLKEPIDLLGVKGSGIDIARVDFFRRAMDINYLKKKKLVIWVFAAYELTESGGWKKIPVRR